MSIHKSCGPNRGRLTGLGLVLLAACADPTGLGEAALQVEGMSLAELGQRVETAAARVEITLRPGSPVAQRVVVKTGDELAEDERVSGVVTGLDVEGGAGVLTLSSGVAVTFDGETVFAGRLGDAADFEQFVGHIAEALALGREPRIKAVRDPAGVPQAPGDPLFVAAALRVTDDPVPSMIVLNVDRDNLTIVDQPPPDAILTVLGLELEIRVREGLTELVLDLDDRRELAFEGVVDGVRPDAGTFVLVHGDRETMVRVGDGTRMALEGEEIESLTPVARALEAGHTVVAIGEGVAREGADGILALVVRFKLRDGHREDVRFAGRVREIDVGAGRIYLIEGPTVQVSDATHLKVNGEPIESLERIAAALDDGLPVFAAGEGVVEGGSDLVHAVFVRFEIDGGDDGVVEFAGAVASVHLDAGTFELVGGATIKVTDQTDFADGSAFAGLDGVAQALAAGHPVFVEGRGTVVGDAPRTIAAQVLKFRVGD